MSVLPSSLVASQAPPPPRSPAPWAGGLHTAWPAKLLHPARGSGQGRKAGGEAVLPSPFSGCPLRHLWKQMPPVCVPSSTAALRAHVGSPTSPATAGRPSRSPAGPQPGGQGPGSTCPFFVHLPGDQGWQCLLK